MFYLNLIALPSKPAIFRYRMKLIDNIFMVELRLNINGLHFNKAKVLFEL